jgi:dihydroorotate dehydrogenase (NAD+) catalytic subunit
LTAALEARLGPLTLKNPILTASGTFGYGLEFTDFVDLARLGGICTKGLSLLPHAGNVPPRICETPAGMLNAIGLQNVGVEVFLREKLPVLTALGATVIANVWGDVEEDYVAVVNALEQAENLAAIELNISCPNVAKGGMLFGNSPPATASLVARVRAATRRTLVV